MALTQKVYTPLEIYKNAQDRGALFKVSTTLAQSAQAYTKSENIFNEGNEFHITTFNKADHQRFVTDYNSTTKTTTTTKLLANYTAAIKFALPPAMETQAGGKQIPDIKPGILYKYNTNVKPFSIPGGRAAHQVIGFDSTMLQVVGLLIGVADSAAASFNAYNITDLTKKTGTQASSTTAADNAYIISQRFIDYIYYKGIPIKLTFNSKALYTQNNNVLYNSTVLGGKSDIAISHVCLIQGIRYFVARHDRVYYALDLIIIDDPSYLNLNYGLTNSLVAANSSGDSPASKTITDTISTLQTTITSIKEDLNNVTDPTTKGNLNTELTNAENQLKDLVDKYTKLKSSGQLTPDEEKKILSDLTALSKLIGSLKSKVTSTIANQTNKTSTPTGTGTDKEDKNDSDFWSNVEDVMKFIVDNPIPTALGLIAGAAGLYFGSSYLLSKIPPKNSPEKPPDDDNNNDGGTTTNGNPDGNDGGGGTNQILETLWKDYNDAVASGSYVDAYKIAEQIEIQKEKLDTSNTAIYTSYLNKLDGIFVLKNDFLNSAFFQNLINPNPSTTTTIATNPTTSTNPNPFDTGINLDGSLGGGTGPVTFPQPGTIPTTTTGTGGGISPTNPLNIDAELTAFGSGTDLDLFTDIEFLNALNFKNNIITAKADLINGNQIKVVTNAEAVSPQIITQLINNSNPDTGIINITSTDLTNLTDAEINNAITTSYQIKGGNVNTLGTGALAVQTGTNIYRPITSNGILSDKEVVIINGANGTTTIEIRQGGKVLDAITSSPTTVGSDVSRAIKKALVAF